MSLIASALMSVAISSLVSYAVSKAFIWYYDKYK